MNFVQTKRRVIHLFFMASIFVSVASPVYAVTADLTSQSAQEVIPVTRPVPLVTPKPEEPNIEADSGKITEEITEAIELTPAPTEIPTPTPTQIPTAKVITPTSTTAVTVPPIQTGGNTSTGGLNADVLFSMSNNYRAGLGLPPFQTDARICSLAAARAPQIAAEIAGGYMHAGKDSHGFPYRFTENIITMRSEQEAFNWWINDHIHRVQIEAPNTHSCVACAGNACTQEFTSFQPR